MKKWVLVLGFVFCLTFPLIGAEVELEPNIDSHINKTYPDDTYGSNQSLVIGTKVSQGTISLIQFDLTSLTGNIVDQAVLRLYTLSGSEYSPGGVDIYRIAAPWDENMVTWNNQPPENRDINLLRSLPPSSGSWFESSVGEIVQTWLEGSFPNHGFYLSVPDQGKLVVASMASKEYADPALRPRLYIQYHATGVTDDRIERVVMCRIHSISCQSVDVNLDLPSPVMASLRIYDACGSVVETLIQNSLIRENSNITWQGSPGVYFLLLTTPDVVVTKKFIIAR
ncbi:DNRLRE domain-containing protein [candidate division WOR-3 bacterium]|nr:DNRLRE domain-containing protein [candidate division WOR-3 bacterium]